MLSSMSKQRVARLLAQSPRFARAISSKANLQTNTDAVRLRGKFLPGVQKDLPTLIWLADLMEPCKNFEKFFMREDNKVRQIRNVWLLDYRNFGDSDHHSSFGMEEMTNDIVRFMDEQKLTMATIGGHGFGAKVATATAINNINRFTGVILLEGGPLNHQYYEAYQELEGYVEACSKINLENLQLQDATKKIAERVECQKWRSIFVQNLVTDKGPLQWRCNLQGLHQNMRKFVPDVAYWGPSYGLWPGNALAIFAAQSRWVHLATNTLQFYNVFPRLEGQFPGHMNFHADGHESPLNHWLHEYPEEQVFYLSQKMFRWLRWHDGKHLMLADKSEAGWYFVPDRGYDLNTNTGTGEYTPEHVHHNYLYTDAYEKSREKRGKEAAGHGQFVPLGQWSPKDKWF